MTIHSQAEKLEHYTTCELPGLYRVVIRFASLTRNTEMIKIESDRSDIKSIFSRQQDVGVRHLYLQSIAC